MNFFIVLLSFLLLLTFLNLFELKIGSDDLISGSSPFLYVTISVSATEVGGGLCSLLSQFLDSYYLPYLFFLEKINTFPLPSFFTWRSSM